jgi:hypothetical protein
MRRLVISLAVVLGLLTAGDFGFKAYAEAKFSAQIRDGVGLEQKPDLSLGGFPFTLAMLSGKLPSATVTADGVTRDGLRIEHIEIELRTVTFNSSAVLSGRSGTIHAKSGTGTATVTAEDMTAYINMQGYPGRVAFAARIATIDTAIAGVNITAKGPLRIADGKLVFEPTEARAGNVTFPVDQVGFSFELPRPFEGFNWSGITVAEGSATLKIKVVNAAIQIQPQPAK